MADFDTYNREIQPAAAVSFNGRNFLAPIRGLKSRLARGNEVRAIFQSPSSNSTINSGTMGPTQWSYKLESLSLTFLKNVYIQFVITNTTGGALTLYNYHSFINQIELQVSGSGSSDANASATTYIWPDAMYFMELDQAVQGANFTQIAQNIGISTTLSSGNYPGLYESVGLAAGASAVALLKLPDPLIQADIPLNLSKADYNLRIFWSSDPTAYGAAVGAGDIVLSDIKLNLHGLRLSERLHSLIRQRLQAAPLLCPIAYFRSFPQQGFVTSAGSMTQSPYLQSQGQIYGVRNFFTTSSTGFNRFRPLTTILGNGAARVAVYSQSSGNYIFNTYANSISQYVRTLMYDREPLSPLPNLSIYDCLNNMDILETMKTGADGATYYLSPNDATIQITPLASTTCVWNVHTLTAGVLIMGTDGSISIRWYES